MNPKTISKPRVLGIAPCVQGIGFVVFNGPRLPIDWGVRWARYEKNVKGVANITKLIDHYRPDVLVFEDHQSEGSRRAKRIGDLLDVIAETGRKQNITTVSYSRIRVRKLFAIDGAVNKFQIAKNVAERIPELAPRLPGKRKIWLPEHANMSIFDAASLALTHFSTIAEEGKSGVERAA